MGFTPYPATLNLRQRLSPENLRTQVFTTGASLKIGAFSIGSAVAGATAGGLGARGMLAVAGGGQLLSLVIGLVPLVQAKRKVRFGPERQ